MANRSKPCPAHSSPSTGDAASFNAASTPLPDFPVVGIGCSAGGLEALGGLLSGAPPDSGMAFIVVQHLDPEHPSNLPELLQRDTPMPVVEAGDGMLVRPDCVYVIPPNKDLSLLHGALHLLDPTEKRGLRLGRSAIHEVHDPLRERRIVRSEGVGWHATVSPSRGYA